MFFEQKPFLAILVNGILEFAGTVLMNIYVH